MKSFNFIILLLSVEFVGGCAVDHSSYVKNMTKLDAAHYSKIHFGEPQNFTAVKMRVLDRKMQHEISNSNDPGVQAQISNYGDFVYYTDNTSAVVQKFIMSPLPDWAKDNWDKYAIRDIEQTSNIPNYVALGKATAKQGKVIAIDDKDYTAKIKDSGNNILYSDGAVTIKLYKKDSSEYSMHKDWDAAFFSEDKKYGILRSKKKGVYRFLYRTPATI